MDQNKKKRQLNNKTKRTKVRLKGDIVEKRRIALGITSQEEAAREAGCDLRTYQRAIGGEPILVYTAKQICNAIDLKLKKVLIIELKNDMAPDDVLKHDTEGSDPIIAAFVQANDAIENNMVRLGIWGMEEINTVFALLLTRYGSAIARQSGDLDVGYEFVDTAALVAKTQIPKFFEPEDTDSDESE